MKYVSIFLFISLALAAGLAGLFQYHHKHQHCYKLDTSAEIMREVSCER